MLPLLLAAAAAPVLGSVVGNALAGGDDDRARAAREAALQKILGIDVPSIEQQRVALAKNQVVGTLNPEMEGTVSQGDSEFQSVSVDPRLRQAQMTALSQLGELGTKGLTAEDRVALMQMSNQASGDANAASQAVMQNMNARGMGGGGAELAARLIASQGAANREAQAGQSLAAQAQAKALQAMSNAGALGSQMESQQFGEDASKAAAQDAINRFNAANRQGVIHSNTGATNAAKEYNVTNAQSVANRNTDIANTQEMHNKGLYQTQFGNKMQQGQAAANQYGQTADYNAQQADRTRGMYAGLGQAVGSGLAAVGASKGLSKSPSTGAVKSPIQNQLDSITTAEDTEKAKKAYNAYGQA